MGRENGVVGLTKASFLFDDGFIVQWENDNKIIKIKDPLDKGIYVYNNAGKSFPDAMNAMNFKREHINNPQLLFKGFE
ncbi:MAG: hypothetical protein IPM56_16160 [Ignavibacteriales bacterium]|nr:MAG: hypothetical protein IPM56_16160 [Ignavibacteriales bacterium]